MVQGGWEGTKRNRDMFVHGCTDLVEERLLVMGVGWWWSHVFKQTTGNGI